MSLGANLDTTELDRIARELGVKTDRVGMRFAFQVEGLYKLSAPKDTSAMASDAQSKRPDAVLERHPKPTGNVIANVGPSVEYAAYVEYGTSRMAAQPALGPAVESLESKFNSGKEWEEIVK